MKWIVWERPSFAILDREVTKEELTAFDVQYDTASDSEVAGSNVTWYDAVHFCRWLSAKAGPSELEQAYADPQFLPETDVPHGDASRTSPADWPLPPELQTTIEEEQPTAGHQRPRLARPIPYTVTPTITKSNPLAGSGITLARSDNSASKASV